MKNIKTYESFCDVNITNEEVNWKNAIVGAALAASLSSCVEHEGEECTILMRDQTVTIGTLEDSNPNEIIINNNSSKGDIAIKKDEIQSICYGDHPKYDELKKISLEMEQIEKDKKALIRKYDHEIEMARASGN